MQLTPEVKAQLAEQKKDCVFCKIIKKEIPAKIVFEDPATLAVLDIYPATKGHTLYLLKEHYPIMPYLPVEDFHHLFGLLPQLTKAIKSAMVSVALNIFIANGGAAGQQYPHFLIHLMPRDEGDNFFPFLFNKKNKPLAQDKLQQIQSTLQQIMQNYFLSSPQFWHNSSGTIPSHLTSLAKTSTVLYEDEKVLCLLPTSNLIEGHIELYSKTEPYYFEKLSQTDAIHFFTVASFVASLQFQILQCQGTNLIIKSGITDDNKSGTLCLNILPRTQNDSLQSLHWEPKQPTYKLEDIEAKIKDKTWNIKYKIESPKEPPKPEPKKSSPFATLSSAQPSSSKALSVEDEIAKAIEKAQRI